MSFQCSFMLLGLIFHLPSISSTGNEDLQLHAATSLQNPISNEVTSVSLRSWKGDQNGSRHEHHLRNVHGILNVLGWGTLMPVGAIVARYFRKQPMFCNDWYPLHQLFQILGYILGTIGWSIGISLLRNASSTRDTANTHRVLGIIIFSFSNIQMLATWIQPNEEHKCRKYWEICHRLVGYALIALIVANIFQGLSSDKRAEKWKWTYVGLVGVLACISATLEAFRWSRSRKHQQIHMSRDSNL